jgi:hypothetical protein
MRGRQVSQTEEQRKRRRGSTLKREDTKLKKEKRKHMSETAERWRETVPKQTIKEAIHLGRDTFQICCPASGGETTTLTAQVRYVVISISIYCCYNFLMLMLDVFCKFLWQQIQI